MRKNQVQHVLVHTPDDRGRHVLSDKLNAFHVDTIGQKLKRSALSTAQKIAVVDKIIENLKLRDVNGILK